jgi:hypothetical protein
MPRVLESACADLPFARGCTFSFWDSMARKSMMGVEEVCSILEPPGVRRGVLCGVTPKAKAFLDEGVVGALRGVTAGGPMLDVPPTMMGSVHSSTVGVLEEEVDGGEGPR